MRGEYGVDDERREKLGDRYQEVQDLINYVDGASASQLVDDVERGMPGVVPTRSDVLGDRFNEVQAIVNQSGGSWHLARLHRQERRHAQRDWRYARHRLAYHRKQERHRGTLYDLPPPEAFLYVQAGHLTGARLFRRYTGLQQPPIWCFCEHQKWLLLVRPNDNKPVFRYSYNASIKLDGYAVGGAGVPPFLISSTPSLNRAFFRVLPDESPFLFA